MTAQTSQASYARHPGPSKEWAALGACARHPDPDLWFITGNQASQEQAAAICDTCPVKVRCLDYALSVPGLQGTWGGTTATARTRLRAPAVRSAA